MDNVEIIKQWLEEQHYSRALTLLRRGVVEEMATDLASRLNGHTSASHTTAGAKSVMHPTRRAVLRALWVGRGDSPKEIADTLEASINATSYHLRMLKDYGAVEMTHATPVRGALRHHYRLTEDGRQLCLELFGPVPTS